MMKMNKEVLKAIYNVFSDCGVKHSKYGEGMATLHDLFQLFDGEDEIDIDMTTDLRPSKDVHSGKNFCGGKAD